MLPSHEQRAIIEQRLRNPSSSLRAIAYAGAGKTTLLQLLAEADGARALYLAYNKSIQTEAENRFPGNVMCRTTHSLAFGAMRMFDQKHRLNARLMGQDVAAMFAIPALDSFRPSQWGQWVIDTVRNFTYSADREIGPQHLAALPSKAPRAADVIGWARRLWTLMADPRESVPFDHDAYLKMWQLRGARFPRGIETIFFDEAQDANPATLDIVQNQRLPMVAVGDPFQSIYQYRGAVNAMREIDAPAFHLSQSYRFGTIPAQIAGAILWHHSMPPEVPIRGNPDIATEIGAITPADGPYTVLCRTNAGVFEEAIKGNDRICILGGAEPIIKLLMGGWRLYRGERVMDVASLCRFRTYDEMVQYAEESEDRELNLLHKIIKEHEFKVPELTDSLKRRAVNGEAAADRVLGTAHKGKGREWHRVKLAEDFATLDDLREVDDCGRPKKTPEEIDQELNLLYVASTRAQFRFEPNEAVKSCVRTWRAERGARAA